MKILFIGDIVGKPGRQIVRRAIPAIVDCHGVDLVIANVENAAGGVGITREIGENIRDYGVQVMKNSKEYSTLEYRLHQRFLLPEHTGILNSDRISTIGNRNLRTMKFEGRRRHQCLLSATRGNSCQWLALILLVVCEPS